MAIRQARLEPLALSVSGRERMVKGPMAASKEQRIDFSAGIACFGDILTKGGRSSRSGPVLSLSIRVRFVASSRPVMRQAKMVFRHYPMFRHRSATPAGVTGNGDVRSLGDNVSSILGSAVNARADTATASITAVGGQQSGTGQPR